MEALATMTTTNTRSANWPVASRARAKLPRMRLNSVRTFSRRIEATLRLDAGGSEGPRSASRRAASSELSPRVLIPGAP